MNYKLQFIFISIHFFLFSSEINIREIDPIEKIKITLDSVLLSREQKNNFCFIHIPKNATSTMEFVLKTYALHDFNTLEERAANLEKLTVVRNPLYRPISIYNEVMKLRKDGDYKKTLLSKFYHERDNLEKSFSLFLEEIEGNFYEPHISFQYKALTNKNLTLDDMDFIFLFEKLDDDIKKFCRKNRISYTHEKLNKTPEQRKTTLVDFINNNTEIQEKIYKIFMTDFDFYKRALEKRKKINKDYLSKPISKGKKE